MVETLDFCELIFRNLLKTQCALILISIKILSLFRLFNLIFLDSSGHETRRARLAFASAEPRVLARGDSFGTVTIRIKLIKLKSVASSRRSRPAIMHVDDA